jgi:hypothetical protein
LEKTPGGKKKGGESRMRVPLVRHLSWLLVFVTFIIGVAPRVDAGLSPSEVVALNDRAADLGSIQKVLETKMVRERLGEFGFTPDEVRARLERLDDRQLHGLAMRLDELQTGGDGLGVVIALLVIAILVVILLQLTGHRVIVVK